MYVSILAKHGTIQELSNRPQQCDPATCVQEADKRFASFEVLCISVPSLRPESPSQHHAENHIRMPISFAIMPVGDLPHLVGTWIAASKANGSGCRHYVAGASRLA